MPSPSVAPSISTTGMTKAEAEVMNASSAACASATVKLRSSTVICASRASRSTWRMSEARWTVTISGMAPFATGIRASISARDRDRARMSARS